MQKSKWQKKKQIVGLCVLYGATTIYTSWVPISDHFIILCNYLSYRGIKDSNRVEDVTRL